MKIKDKQTHTTTILKKTTTLSYIFNVVGPRTVETLEHSLYWVYTSKTYQDLNGNGRMETEIESDTETTNIS